MILNLFQYPLCRGVLSVVESMDKWAKEEDDLYCEVCEKRFPVINGIPFFVDLHRTGWVGIEKTYELWLNSEKEMDFTHFFRWMQTYSAVSYGNYDDLILMSKALASENAYQFFLHQSENQDILKWCETQDGIYDWVLEEVVDSVGNHQVILDVGVGGATVETYLSEHLNATNTIIGMDIASDVLFLFRKLLPLNQVILTCGDFRKSPLQDDRIDVIVSTGGFQHIDQFEKALHEFKRVLKKGGQIFMMAFHHLPHDKEKTPLYDAVDIPYNGLILLERFKDIGFSVVQFDENIAKHPTLKQYGAILKKD